MDQSKSTLEEYNPLDRTDDRKIGIYDCTLRDGEQAAGVVFDRHDKLEIALFLDRIGVDRIEVGMPVISPDDQAATEDIVSAGLDAELWGFCRCLKKDVDACIKAGVKHVILEAPTSKQKLTAYNLTREGVLQNALKMIEYARSKGLYVAFFAVDATRTEEGFLAEVKQSAVEVGAQELVLADTLSVASPNTISHLSKKLIAWTGVPLMIHCHNDFGLATACTLAGVQAGASYAHVTANGLGEKAGNADLAEVVASLSTVMGYQHNVDMTRLPQLAQLIERLSGVSLAPQKPIIGEKSFIRESGVVISQLNTHPPAVEAYAPSLFGRQTKVVLGKKSGKSSIQYFLDKHDLPPLSDRQAQDLLREIKAMSLEKKRSLKEKEILELLKPYQIGKEA